MSQGETLLVVHNAYGLRTDAGLVSEKSLTNVSYWLDHFLRPEGERRRAVDAIYYKRKSYDGRIVVVLTSQIDWTQPQHCAHLRRGLGAHNWAQIVKKKYQDVHSSAMQSLVFEFDQKRFAGKRDHVQHFGYTAVFDAPQRLDSYRRDNVDDDKIPVVLWPGYPPASYCTVPRMNEQIEVAIQTNVQDMSGPSEKASQNVSPTPGTFLKTDPSKDDSDIKPEVKREPGVNVELTNEDEKLGVKFEDASDKPLIKTETYDIKPTSLKRNYTNSNLPIKQESYKHRDIGSSSAKRVKFEERD